MTEIRTPEEMLKIIAKLTSECILLQERNASEHDMMIWRQTVRERYPIEWSRLLLSVRKRFPGEMAG